MGSNEVGLRIAELLSEALRRGIEGPFLITCITAKNRVLVVRAEEHGSSEVLFQEPGHESANRDELPIYIINERPVHIIISDKSVSVHGMFGEGRVVQWVN
jgi:hypothetical protein